MTVTTDARHQAGLFLAGHGHHMGDCIYAGKVQDYLEEYEAELTRLRTVNAALVDALVMEQSALRDLVKQLPTDERLGDFSLDFAESSDLQTDAALALARGEQP